MANEIDRALAKARADGRPVPEEEAGALKERFLAQARAAYDEFRGTRAQLSYRDVPRLKEEAADAYKFFRDLSGDRDAYLRFLTDLKVEPTNNAAERALRPLKLAMKVMGGFRGASADYAVLESYLATALRRGLSVHGALLALAKGDPGFLLRGGKEEAAKKGGLSIATAPKVSCRRAGEESDQKTEEDSAQKTRGESAQKSGEDSSKPPEGQPTQPTQS